ncbi:hypothetical protein PR002_g12941 [Phytophthora rubi]|uniref:Uncharacterized protein n=1 Tax=Phytophthora rubi TaxID=129364 RepID=A0A6A3LKG5_9STRA|nr:hypothetical protein PR002_g12941 [Phytophthora rubi]
MACSASELIVLLQAGGCPLQPIYEKATETKTIDVKGKAVLAQQATFDRPSSMKWVPSRGYVLQTDTANIFR